MKGFGNMWAWFVDRVPSHLGLFCTFLAFFIPFVTYRINRKLHQEMDPPWKRENAKAQKD